MVWRLCRRLQAVGPQRIAWVLGLSAAAGVMEGAGVLALVPLLTWLGVGGDGEAGGDGRFLLALAGYVGLVAAAALTVRARGIAVQTVILDVLDRLRGDLHRAVLAMEWSRFRSLRVAGLQQALTGEIGRIGYAVSLTASLAGVLLGVPFVLAAALLLSPAMTVAALTVAAAVMLATRRLGAQGFRLNRTQGEVNRAAIADLADDLAGMRIIKSFGVEEARAGSIAARFAAIRGNQLAYARTLADERAVLQTAAAVAAAGALYAAVSVFQVPLAEGLVLILAYGRLLQTSFRGLSNWRQLTGAVAALASYDETLARCWEGAEPVAAAAAPALRRTIQLCGVRVAYHTEEGGRAGLDGIDAEIPAGAVTALIGPSGAGKSTLADLAAGLTVPDAGEIRIDGTPLTPEHRAAWRQRVAVVPQDPFMFHDTIAANLRLARPDADDGDVWAALEQAAAADFVRALPLGLETVVGDRGARLSGGERQRIVLARALLRRPALLVLDEATASLDAETEAAVARALDGLRGTCTMVVVAHRPSTVRAADHVLLLDDGRLAAAGSWDAVRRTAAARLAALGMMEAVS